jgi:translocation protein SEC62
MNGPTPPPVNLVPGQQPTRAQVEAIQEHMRQDAQRMGLNMDQYIAKLKEAHQQQLAAQQRQQAAQQGGHQHGPDCNHDHDHEHQHAPPQQHQPVQPGPPKPEALALAAFLKNQNLKLRTCIFQEKRKDMFRGEPTAV